MDVLEVARMDRSFGCRLNLGWTMGVLLRFGQRLCLQLKRNSTSVGLRSVVPCHKADGRRSQGHERLPKASQEPVARGSAETCWESSRHGPSSGLPERFGVSG